MQREITASDLDANGHYPGDLYLRGYAHPLPAALAKAQERAAAAGRK